MLAARPGGNRGFHLRRARSARHRLPAGDKYRGTDCRVFQANYYRNIADRAGLPRGCNKPVTNQQQERKAPVKPLWFLALIR